MAPLPSLSPTRADFILSVLQRAMEIVETDDVEEDLLFSDSMGQGRD
jgi:hypothetical protein